MNENEVWRPVVGYEGKYEVSNLGRVRSLNYKRQKGKVQVLMPVLQNNGYYYVSFFDKSCGQRKPFGVHRLVAFAFPEICGEWFENAHANHKNEVKTDNRAENLEWLSPEANTNYGTGRQRQTDKVSKPVRMLSLDGIPLKVFPSANEAARSFGKKASSHICDVANGVKWHISAYGYRWEWA